MNTSSSLAPALHAWLQTAWSTVVATPLPARGWALCPRPELADLTHAGALLASRSLPRPAREVAQAWADALPPHPWVAAATVEGPGHLNLRLSKAGWQALLDHGVAAFEGVVPPPPTLVEFVSANPTGPLHLGHARQAVLGDVIARLLRRLGGRVATEFFYNDAGVQMDLLVVSVRLRADELQGTVLLFERDGAQASDLQPGQALFPAAGYHGADIIAHAQAFLDQGGSLADEEALKAHAVAAIQADQKATLALLGVAFDGWVSERDLHKAGYVQAVVDGLMPHAYQALAPRQADGRVPAGEAATEPAWFLPTTAWGDDKDRVMVKADGSVTYFVPDVAYHLDKWQRGWTRALNIQGSDHHGTLQRVRAGLQLLAPDIGPDYPQVLFHTMIKVVQGGVPVQASKRAGDMLTARQVMGWVGVDAFRLAMLDKRPESQMVLDIDRWTHEGAANPVYAVQYAHARLCSTLDRLADTPPGDTAAPDWVPAERRLLAALLLWPDRIDQAAVDRDPVRAATWVRDLAGVIHEAYQQGPKLLGLDAASRAPRGTLFELAAAVLREGGALLGIACPTRMTPRPEALAAVSGPAP